MCIIPASYILYDVLPARALSQVTFLLSATMALIFFLLGRNSTLPNGIPKLIFSRGLALLPLLVGYTAFQQYNYAKNFSTQYDERITDLKKLQQAGDTNTVIVKPLPPSGFLYSDDLSTDSINNVPYKKIVGLDFQLVKK